MRIYCGLILTVIISVLIQCMHCIDIHSSRDHVINQLERNGLALRYASEEFKNDEELVLIAVSNNGKALRHASAALQNTYDVVLAAVRNDGMALRFASETFKNNHRIVLTAVKKIGWALQHASRDLQNNFAIASAAVNQIGLALQYASSNMQNNYSIVLAAVMKRGDALQYASDFLRNMHDIVLAAMKRFPASLQYASVSLRNLKSIVMYAVSRNGLLLEFASNRLKGYKDVVFAALHQNALALQFASPKLRKTFKVVLAAVTSNGMALQYASENLQNNKEIVLPAISNDANAMQFASESLRDDDDIFKVAIRRNISVFKFASERIRNLKSVVLPAIKQCASSFKIASEQLKNNFDFALLAVRENPAAIEHVSEHLLKDWEFVSRAVKQTYECTKWLPKTLQDLLPVFFYTWEREGWQLQDKLHLRSTINYNLFLLYPQLPFEKFCLLWNFCHYFEKSSDPDFKFLTFFQSIASSSDSSEQIYSQLGYFLIALSLQISRIEYNQLIGRVCSGVESNFCDFLRTFPVRDNGNVAISSGQRALRITFDRTAKSLSDIQNQIMGLSNQRIQSGARLFVNFIGEKGIDAGGLTKECFALVTEELKNPQHNLFLRVEREGGEKYLPNPNATSKANLATFFFIGKFIGLAIRHKVQLDIDFLPYIFKQMLGIKMSFEDLKYFDDFLHRSLKQMIDADHVENWTVNFSYEIPVIEGNNINCPLIYDGPNTMVTDANKKLYIQLVDESIEQSTHLQVMAMHKGLLSVIPNLNEIPAETLDELVELICGKEIAIEDWKLMTMYGSGYTEDSLTIQYFWQVLESFNQNQRQAILKFWSSCTRLSTMKYQNENPVKNFTIHKINPDNKGSSHTCTNQLDLPDKANLTEIENLLNFYVTYMNSGNAAFEIS